MRRHRASECVEIIRNGIKMEFGIMKSCGMAQESQHDGGINMGSAYGLGLKWHLWELDHDTQGVNGKWNGHYGRMNSRSL